MEDNGNLLYFSERHLNEFRNRYGCTEKDFSYVQVPVCSELTIFDRKRVERVFNQKTFTILSVSRLEFPHKGYILGLVDTFEMLCNKYDSLQLIIVGDGKDLGVLKNKIENLKSVVAKKIKIIGAVSPDDLSVYYDNANVLVSIAGCLILGARRGVLSLPARHYTKKCEVYGYLPESKDYVLADSVGSDVLPYIEEIINMSFDEYLIKCQASFDTFPVKEERYFDQIYNKTRSVLRYSEIVYIKVLAVHNKACYLLRKVKGKINGV